MKNKKSVIIATALIAVCLFAGILIIHNTQSKNEYTLESTHNEYAQVDNSIVATVNGADITSKQVCLVKYSYHTNNAVDKAIEQTAIVQLAKQSGFSLNKSDLDKETKYIESAYESLNLPNSEDNLKFKEELKRNHLEMATSIKFQEQIRTQISEQSFSCDNEKINKKYDKYKNVYNEWENGGKESKRLYNKAWSLREVIAQDYIDYMIKQFKTEKY